MKTKRILFLLALSVFAASVVITVVFQAANKSQEPSRVIQNETKAPPPPTEAKVRKARQQEFVRLVKLGRFGEAAEFASVHSVHVDSPLMHAVSELQAKGDVDPQVHFNVIDFFLKHGRFGNAWNPDQLRVDYCRLVTLRKFFHWESPPEGSLPKHIPLVLNDRRR